jgi:hypothetical protein
MVQGNFAGHDYFIDCGLGSLSAIRAIFGAYITLYVTIIAVCARSVYRSWIRRKLFNPQLQVSLWSISPTTTINEVFELRSMLARSLSRGEIFYTLASLACIVVAIISAASTSIANHTVESNIVNRTALVSGRLVSRWGDIVGESVDIAAQVRALEYANAPLEQLFDYVPNDTSGWIFVGQEWNNTWQGRCSYHLYPAVDLRVHSTNFFSFQHQIPLLSTVLPQWATVDPKRQGMGYSMSSHDPDKNGTGAYRDYLITYFFGSVPDTGGFPYSTSMNISLANVLLHNVGRTSSGNFEETSFKSDVNVVECMFNNTVPGFVDQAYGPTGHYANTVQNVAEVSPSEHLVYGSEQTFQMSIRSVVEAFFADQPVVQPTAKQMLRYWQAYMSVKNTKFPHLKQRTLTVARPVVQIRLSSLVVTIGTMTLAICAALSMMDWDGYTRSLHIPASQADWAVLAACEHRRMVVDWDSSIPALSPAEFAAQHRDMRLAVSHTADGRPMVRIVLAEKAEELSSLIPRLL